MPYELTQFDTTKELCRAVRHKTRLSIVNLLEDNHELCVEDISKNIDLEQSVASQHLKILRDSNIVSCRRNDKGNGKYIYYKLNRGILDDVSKLFALVDRVVSIGDLKDVEVYQTNPQG